MAMELGIVGLGPTGLNVCRCLLRDGHKVYAYDELDARVAEAEAAGAVGLSSIEELVRMRAPRTVWLAVPPGESTAEIVQRLSGLLTADDTVIDAGDAFYKDSIARHRKFKGREIHFVDAATGSGNKSSARGCCLMIGGEREPFERLAPIFQSLAGEQGYALVGGPGAGHFCRMIHRAIEDALRRSYAEGFELLRLSDFKFDLQQIAHLWNQGGGASSRLLELAERAFAKDPELAAMPSGLPGSNEERCTVQEAVMRDAPLPVITLALLAGIGPPQRQSFQSRVLAALDADSGNPLTEAAG